MNMSDYFCDAAKLEAHFVKKDSKHKTIGEFLHCKLNEFCC